MSNHYFWKIVQHCATVVLFLLPFTIFLRSPPLWRGFHIIYTCLGHPHRTLVHHLNLYSSICLIKHLPWLSVNGSGWDYTVQRSSPHKCGQKSCCNAFNAAVAAFPLDISVFLSSPYVPKVYPHRWRFLEGHPSHPGACSTNIHIIYTCLGHLHRTLVHHLNLYSSICLIKHLSWLSVNGSGWDYTIQMSSSHKCGQKSCCNAFNAVVADFPLDISVFLSSSYVPKVYPHRWRFLEGHPSHPGACLTDIRPVRGG